MTRKDYELIAGGMRITKPPMYGEASDQWEYDCRILAEELEKDNPRFNVHKFLEACGVE